MRKKLSKALPFLFITAITILIFRQFFFSGLHPFPGDFMLAWYEPWKTDNSQNGVITLPHKPIADDIFRQLYPFKVLGMDMIKQGQWPLWNPYNGAGQPLLATMHVGLLNPLNIIFFLFDNPTAWSLQVILSVFFIGCTTYLYSRKIGLSTLAALFSTLVFMLSGFVITRSIYNDYNFAVLCLPLLLYLFEDYVKEKTSRKILFMPFVIFFMYTVVQPQIIALVLIFFFFYILFRLQSTHRTSTKSNVRTAIPLLTLFFIGVGFASIQLFPTFELYQHANVTSDSSRQIIERFLLPFGHLITILIPNYFGNQASYNYWGAGDYVESIASVGIIPVLFTVSALAFAKNLARKLTLFFLISAIISALLTINHGLTRFIYSLPIPIFSTGVPSRIFFITSFSIAIASGLGFDMWRKQIKLEKRTLIYTGIFLLALAGVVCYTVLALRYSYDCNNSVVMTCRMIALRNSIAEFAFFIPALFCMLLYIMTKKRLIRQVLPITIILVVVISGLYNAGKFLPFTKKSNIMPVHDVIEVAKEKAILSRIFGLGAANLKTNFATQYRYFDPTYYDPLYIKRYGELIAFANTGSPSNLTRSDVEIASDITLPKDKSNMRDRLFSILSISHLLYATSESDLKQYPEIDSHPFEIRFSSSVPRAFTVSKAQTVPDKVEELQLLFSDKFNPEESVILEKDVHLTGKSKEPQKGTVRFVNYNENNLELSTNTPNSSILVLNDTYYPGWRAFVDGKETLVLRANYTFRAIELPAGKHMVLFSFEPSSVRIGLYVSLFFVFLYALLFRFWPKIRGNEKQ